ncbi:MAG: SPOR domain-containing protein [Bacteroidota bacterium]
MNLNIDIYLRTAFKELDAFSIQGIGTFKKVHRAAQVDEAGLRVMPPMAEFEFEQEVHSSLLFNKYLIENLQFDLHETEGIIQGIQNHLLHALKSTGRFEVPDIGLLSMNESGDIHFLPYGLGDEEVAGEYFGLRPVSYTKSKTIPIFAPEITADMNQEPHVEPARSFKSVGWKSALLVLLLGTLGLMILKPRPFYQHRSSLISGLKIRINTPDNLASATVPPVEAQQEQAAPITDKTETLPTENKSTTNLPAEEKTSPSVTESTPTPASSSGGSPTARIAQPVERTRGLDPQSMDAETFEGAVNLSLLDTTASKTDPKARELPPVNNYHLVTGSFTALKSANRYVAQLKKQGYSSIIILPSSGSSQTYRVSVFRSSKRSEVEAFSNKWKNQGKEAGWIYEERK